jgi:bifunctional DNA-binding transcriptional regulator/antitoxin component of YhaV-PrlF toxin-antitoxin module
VAVDVTQRSADLGQRFSSGLNGVPNEASAPEMTATYCPQRSLRSTDPARRIASHASGVDLYSMGAKVKDMPKVSSKNQVTIPVEAMRAAGLHAGDEITVRPIGEGEIVIATRGSRVRRHAGIAKGIYRDGELDQLRDEWKR